LYTIAYSGYTIAYSGYTIAYSGYYTYDIASAATVNIPRAET
jgi:hypothetical protein